MYMRALYCTPFKYHMCVPTISSMDRHLKIRVWGRFQNPPPFEIPKTKWEGAGMLKCGLRVEGAGMQNVDFVSSSPSPHYFPLSFPLFLHPLRNKSQPNPYPSPPLKPILPKLNQGTLQTPFNSSFWKILDLKGWFAFSWSAPRSCPGELLSRSLLASLVFRRRITIIIKKRIQTHNLQKKKEKKRRRKEDPNSTSTCVISLL